MKVVKDKLVNALKRVMPGIATGAATINGADNFIFHNGYIYSYNSTVSVMIPIGQDLNLEGTVKAIDFFNCLQKLPGDFEIEPKEKFWTLKCGKITVKVNLLEPIESVLDRFNQLEPGKKWIKIPENEFYNALVQCNMPTNKSQYAGIFIENNVCISTDGLQINKFDFKESYPTMWLSNNAVSEILKWNDFTELQLNKTWLQFTNGEVVFSVKTLYSTDVDKVVGKITNGLNRISSGEVILSGTFSDAVYAAIDRATTFSESVMNKDSVIATFDGDELIISAKRKSGEFNESVNIGTHIDNRLSFALALSMIDGASKFYKDFELIVDGNNPPRLLFKNDTSVHMVATLKM